MSKVTLSPPRKPPAGAPDRARSRRRAPLWLKLLLVPGTAAVLLAGVWVFGAQLAPDGTAAGIDNAILVTVAWMLLASFLLGRLRRARPDLGWPLRVGFVAVAVALLTVQYLGSRDKTVSETVVQAPEPAAGAPQPAAEDTDAPPAPARRAENALLAAGDFASGVHMGKGRARAIERARGGRVLTLTGFETDAGPDLFVYLVDGDPDAGSDSIGDHVNLGDLKGNIGDQQYTIPRDVDLTRYDTVVIWCRAFSVNFTQARLARR